MHSFCAKLVGNTKCTFTLFSTHCEFCDGNELNRFTCGGALAPHNGKFMANHTGA